MGSTPIGMTKGKRTKMIGVTESAISQHMRGLTQMRLVVPRRYGKEVYYDIDDAHIITLLQQRVKHVQEK